MFQVAKNFSKIIGYQCGIEDGPWHLLFINSSYRTTAALQAISVTVCNGYQELDLAQTWGFDECVNVIIK